MKYKILRIICFSFIMISLFSVLHAQNVKMEKVVKVLIEDKDLQNASIGIFAQKNNGNEVVCEYNANLSLVPASVMKVLTTGAALKIFGGSKKFYTEIIYNGKIDSLGTLDGDIYIKGGGDPTLGSILFCSEKEKYDFLEIWSNELLKLGIKSIKGGIIADPSIFSRDLIPSTWSWGDIGNYYGAGACGLSVFDNSYEIDFNTKVGLGERCPIVSINPEIPYLEIISEVISGDLPSDNSIIYGSPYANNQLIKGSIPRDKGNFKVRGAIPNSAYFTAFLLDKELRKKGLNITEAPKVSYEENALQGTLIVSYPSPNLDSMIYWTNLKSINLYAEHLLNHIGLDKKKVGETSAGAMALKEFWQNEGIDGLGMFIADGSGLSRANGLTAKQVTAILNNMSRSNEFDSFYASLPIAGRTGSLSTLCKNTFAENNLRAKSGYMSRVRSYAGYVKNRKGELITFTIIVNNYNCSPASMKLKMEKFMVALAESD